MDLGGSPVLKYRELYSKKSGQKIPRYVIPVFVLMILFFGRLTLWNLRKQPGYAAGAAQNVHNLPSMKARKKAVFTILILQAIRLISYLPLTIKARLWLGLENEAYTWLVFSLFVPSAVNPFIVIYRVKRFSDKLEALRNDVKSMCCQNLADKGADSSYFQGNGFKHRPICCHDGLRIQARSTCCQDVTSTKKTELNEAIRKSV